MNSCLGLLVREAVGSDCGEMCRSRGGTFSYLQHETRPTDPTDSSGGNRSRAWALKLLLDSFATALTIQMPKESSTHTTQLAMDTQSTSSFPHTTTS